MYSIICSDKVLNVNKQSVVQGVTVRIEILHVLVEQYTSGTVYQWIHRLRKIN